MSGGRSAQPGCVGAWKAQPGRSRLQRRVCSDGYLGEFPYAGVVVAAEGLDPDDDPSAEIAVNTVRDVFAEGVAYGIEEALGDALREAADIIRRNGHGGCSVAAVAFCGTHAWFASTGACRILKFDEDTVSILATDCSEAESSGLGRDHPEYSRRIRDLSHWLGGEGNHIVTGHTRINPGAVVLAATPGVWMHLREGALKRGAGKNMEGWLATLVRESRVAYRRQGGAVAAASCHSGGGTRIPVLPFVAVSVMVILGVLLAAGVFDSRKPPEDGEDNLFSTPDPPAEVVMPLQQDSSSSRFWSYARIRDMVADSTNAAPDISADLPLGAVLAGGDSTAFSPDTFALAVNRSPDLQWENFAPGIYPLAGDTAAVFLAEVLRARNPGLSVIPLSTIVTVREAGVADAAAWLRNLPAVQASGIGVVVETTSSVAGGAQWIRNFPVFINGNRENQALPGGFLGDSIPGIPSVRNTSCYRLLVIP